MLTSKTISNLTAILSTFLLSFTARSAEELWTTDFAAAKTKAKSEKKLLLLDFTGSDWCGWCIKLHEEVFDLELFKTEAPKKFVLVELDYPQKKVQPKELKAQNNKLQKEFKIEGFPTIIMLDAEGKLIAKHGYSPGGPEKYLKELNESITTHDSLIDSEAKLPAAQGAERAKLMDMILTAQEKLGLESENEETFAAEILTLDPDNKAGLKTKYTVRKLLNEAQAGLAEGKSATASAACDKALAVEGIAPDQKQLALFTKSSCMIKEKDFVAAVACLIQARDAAPASPDVEEISAMIKRNQPKAEAQAAINKLKTSADAAKGIDRAKLLDELIDAESKFIKGAKARANSPEIAKWSAEIIVLDADNKAGLKTKYEFKSLLAEATKQFKAKTYTEAKETITKALALPGLAEDQKTHALKLKKDIDAAKLN